MIGRGGDPLPPRVRRHSKSPPQTPVSPTTIINSNSGDAPRASLGSKRARLADLETPKRMEHLQKLEELKRHLVELEKQYEKGKPLVNLVDNMVKLGSLYRAGTPLQSNGYNPPPPLLRERLEFNHKVQEQRLLAEERKDWDRLSPNHNQLQAKVEQLYRLFVIN
ncbi:uncharacterized protein LOC103506577 [Diaphorina citri]|uniref:Uncharacterized protein LOC103506577 n=1 Tax=Diaphorina citri TaxID=121845 RepID=A0A3Q0IM59_DIACI|nr:uncharacterized protein LOC103506577 [Diaphorina citri]